MNTVSNAMASFMVFLNDTSTSTSSQTSDGSFLDFAAIGSNNELLFVNFYRQQGKHYRFVQLSSALTGSDTYCCKHPNRV